MVYPKPFLYYSSNYRLADGLEQKGFISLLGLSFTFIILAALLILFRSGAALKEKMFLSSDCVHQVLRLQKQLSKPLAGLLKLNSQASRLRLRRLKAEAQIAAGIPTAAAELIVVTQMQIALAAKQQALLLQAQILRQEFTPYAGESRSLAVTPRPPLSLTPNYEPSENFEDVQAQTLKLYRSQKDINFSYQCSGTLEREWDKWTPKLKPVKVSWR